MDEGHSLPHVETLYGRDAELDRLWQMVSQSWTGVASIEGIGGSGKSVLASAFLEKAQRGWWGFAVHFVWSFYVAADPDAFLAALYRALTHEPLRAAGIGRADAVLRALQARKGRVLIVMDGLERIQEAEPPHRLKEASLQSFLERIAEGTQRCLCVVTTRFPLQLAETGFVRIPPPALAEEDAVRLLEGVGGGPDELRRVARECGGHPLTLRLAAGAIRHFLGGEAEGFSLEGVPGEWTEGVPEEERRLVRVMGFLREQLGELSSRLLATLCTFRMPIPFDLLARVLTGGADLPIVQHSISKTLEELNTLGLVERTAQGDWMAHAVVRDFFPIPGECFPIHGIAATHFLSVAPGSSTQIDEEAANIIEEAIHHAVMAGYHETAASVYWHQLGASATLCDAGDIARGERVVREILEHGGSGSTWRPRLLNELAIYLDAQGRLDEAAACYQRALRIRMKERASGDVCRILQNLCDNAIQRGRLPLAEKYATRAMDLAGVLPTEQESVEIYLRYVRHLRGTDDWDFRDWMNAAAPGTAALLAADVLLRQEHAQAAHHVAMQNHSAVTSVSKLAEHRSGLQMVEAVLDQVMASPERLHAQVEATLLAGSAMHAAIEWAQQVGCRPLLIEGLRLRAPVLRHDGQEEAAAADLEEAAALARRHGFRIMLVDVLRQQGATELARALALDPKVDYQAWNHTPVPRKVAEGAARPSAERSEPEARDVPGIVAELNREIPDPLEHPADLAETVVLREKLLALRTERAGLGPVVALTHVHGPHGRSLLLAVEGAFAEDICVLGEARSDDVLSRLFHDLWEHYYVAHQRHEETQPTIYHCGILLLLEGRRAHAALVGEELTKWPDLPLCGAALHAAAIADKEPERAARVLRESLGLARQRAHHREREARAPHPVKRPAVYIQDLFRSPLSGYTVP